VEQIGDLAIAFKTLSDSATDERIRKLTHGDGLLYIMNFILTHITEYFIIEPFVIFICNCISSSDSLLIDKIC